MSMKIKELSLNNFKCFSSPITVELGKLTLFTGANSSGKSSLIYSILGLLQSNDAPFVFSPNGRYVNMGDFKEIVYNHNDELPITIDLKFDDDDIKGISTKWILNKINSQPQLSSIELSGSDYTISANLQATGNYKVRLNYSSDKEVSKQILQFYDLFEQMVVSVDDESATNYRRSLNELRDNTITAEFELSDLAKVENIGVYGNMRYSNIVTSIQTAIHSLKSSINYISSFRLQPDRTNIEINRSHDKICVNGDGYLNQILYWYSFNKEPLKKLVKSLRDLGVLYNIKVKRIYGGRYEIDVKTRKDGVYSSLSDVGFGIPQLLPILVADLQLRYFSTLFVSQPEIHLHPSVQAAMGDYFIHQINDFHKNYIIETHSEYLLNRIRLNIVKGKIDPDDVKVYYIQSSTESKGIVELQFTKDGRILNAPDDFFKTYMIDVIDIAKSSMK